MKFWKIEADYRPKNSNRIPYNYKIKAKDSINKKQIKNWWNNTYPWLRIYNIEEITQEEYEKGNNQFR